MSREEDSELIELLKSAAEKEPAYKPYNKAYATSCRGSDMSEEKEEQQVKLGNLVQWTTSDKRTFIPASHTIDKLIPGVYDILQAPGVGIYFEKVPVKTEGLIRFPQTNSEKVVDEIKKFWDKEAVFKEFGLAYKRGVILYGPAGCHGKGTLIRMFDGKTKKVEDVEVGDLLMGPDSKPRRVLELRHGIDEMYRVYPNKGEPFVVNGNHVLSLRRTSSVELRFPPVMNIKLNDYMNLTKCSQWSFKLYRIGVNFEKKQELPLEPYFLGVWLGDGSEGKTEVNSADQEIKEYLRKYAFCFGLSLTERRKTDSICWALNIVGDGSKGGNYVLNELRNLNVLEDKHIPDNYMYSSVQQRLGLLAGLVDTDGGYCVATWRKSAKFKKKGYKDYFEIIQKRERLAWQIVELARSLGFGVTIKKVKKGIKEIDFEGDYWRLNIFGDISRIPVKLARKKALVGMPNKDPLRTGIRKIESLGKGKFYGFTISGDHLYLTSDYIVHHNSGKSSSIQLIMKDVVERGGIVVKFCHPHIFIEGMRIFRTIQPETPVVVLMEDLDAIMHNYGDESGVLNILDGVECVHKCVFLATTNYPEELGPRVINRPSRFDKRFKIGHPNEESRKLYFEYLMGDKVKELKVPLSKWIEDTNGFSIAHLKELFVAVIILGDEYEDAIFTLSSMKEYISSDQDIERSMGFK